MNAGIPVVSYNADGNTNDPGTNRLAYIGQDLFVSGEALGQKIAASMPSGGDAVGFIATPGTANIQPRIDGAKAALKASGKNINFTSVASGAELPQENTTINAYVLAHKATLKGIFAVDAGSTQTVGAIVAKYGLQGKVASGGFDLTPQTLSAIKSGSLNFTIDQQPYLQGFLPALYLYLWNLSGGLVNPPETNTGLTFVTKSNVGPYLNTTSRYEGSSTQEKLIPHSGAIA
jgi:simple sugar transport system substrate-binding protein